MRPEKQLLLDEVKDKTVASKILMLLSYQNLNANVTANFRSDIIKAGGDFTVIAKRLFRKAAKDAGIVIEDIDYDGHIAFVTSKENPVDTTKAIYTFRKENKDTLNILGGLFEGQACKAEDFEAVAKLPTKDGMRSQMLGLFQAPMSQVVSVMQSLLSSPLYLLENKCAKESES
jgi:large subunit ribosomal protein L10